MSYAVAMVMAHREPICHVRWNSHISDKTLSLPKLITLTPAPTTKRSKMSTMPLNGDERVSWLSPRQAMAS